jgi:hypothetical protein
MSEIAALAALVQRLLPALECIVWPVPAVNPKARLRLVVDNDAPD